MEAENNSKDSISPLEEKVERGEDVSPLDTNTTAQSPPVSRAVTSNNWLTQLVKDAVAAYSNELKVSPIRTKAITSCVISMLGELIGTALKPRKADGTRETVSLRRMAVFAGYGLVITGPFFHWWYGFLEKNVSALKLPSYLVSLVKVAITQIVMTPPFLVFTLAYIKYFLSFDTHETVIAVKKTFAVALLTNWKVWTVAQAVNFQVVPLEYRVLFGNMIALWWNIYLSLTTSAN